MEEKYHLKKINGKWIYDEKFIEWLVNNSKGFSGANSFEKSLHLGRGTLKRILKKEWEELYNEKI